MNHLCARIPVQGVLVSLGAIFSSGAENKAQTCSQCPPCIYSKYIFVNSDQPFIFVNPCNFAANYCIVGTVNIYQQNLKSAPRAARDRRSWKLPNRAAWRQSGSPPARSFTSAIDSTYKEDYSQFFSQAPSFMSIQLIIFWTI